MLTRGHALNERVQLTVLSSSGERDETTLSNKQLFKHKLITVFVRSASEKARFPLC